MIRKCKELKFFNQVNFRLRQKANVRILLSGKLLFKLVSSNQSARLFCLLLQQKATAPQTAVEVDTPRRLLCKQNIDLYAQRFFYFLFV